MNYIDIILFLLLLSGAIKGWLNGFVYEIAVLGAFFLGLYTAFHFAYLLQPTLMKLGKMNPRTVASVSFFIVFLGVSIGIFFLAKLFEGLINIAALGIFNKILGALFGLIKVAFILSIVIYFFNSFDAKHNFISPDKKATSRLYYPLLKISPALLPVLSEIKKDVTGK
jgi:membrane protein required for colicin V production